MRNTDVGSTLLEVLLAVSLLLLLALMTMPPMRHLADRMQDGVLAARIQHLIAAARQQTWVLRRPVGICQTKKFLVCDGGSRDHLMMFVDDDIKGQQTVRVLSVLSLNAAQGGLHWRAYPYSRSYLRMTPQHLTTSDNGVYWYCHNEAIKPAFAVVINHTGLARVIFPDRAGNIRDSRDRLLICAQ